MKISKILIISFLFFSALFFTPTLYQILSKLGIHQGAVFFLSFGFLILSVYFLDKVAKKEKANNSYHSINSTETNTSILTETFITCPECAKVCSRGDYADNFCPDCDKPMS